MSTPRQVSRLWVRRYAQPRDKAGRFAPGHLLWTRLDGATRYVYYPEIPAEDLTEMRWLSDEGRRVLVAIALLIAIAFLVFWMGWG